MDVHARLHCPYCGDQKGLIEMPIEEIAECLSQTKNLKV